MVVQFVNIFHDDFRITYTSREFIRLSRKYNNDSIFVRRHGFTKSDQIELDMWLHTSTLCKMDMNFQIKLI